MSGWDAIIRTALLGTHREPAERLTEQSAVTELLGKLQDGRPAHQLLCTAGTTDLYEQVGRPPERTVGGDVIHPARADYHPVLNARSTYYLSRMLTGPYRSLLPEFLAALIQKGHKFPDILMPNLLAHGAKVVAVRPLILSLLTSNDRRLASTNPAWSYASYGMEDWTDLRRIWDSLSPINRQSLSKQLRATTPELGRELLESTWKIDPDSQRLRLMKTLEISLSMQDEPFLEMALDDRSQLIRRQAAELLAYIPQSRLAQRMAARIPYFLSWTPNNEERIRVRFPGVGPEMVRDGVFGSRNKNLARVRAQQLIQMVSGVPLDYWTAEWQSDPVKILQAIPTTKWTRTLFAGFTWAAFRQKNGSWAKEILWIRGLAGGTNKLVNLLEPSDFGEMIRRKMLQENMSDPLEHGSPLISPLHRSTHSFDAELSQFLLPIYANHFKQDIKGSQPGSLVRSSFLKIARTCPTEPSDLELEIFEGIAPQWESTVMEFRNILGFRREMLEALSGKSE